MRKTKDLVTGLAGLALSAFYILCAQSISVFEGVGATAINSRTLPMLWGVCLAVLSILLLLRYFRSPKSEKSAEKKSNAEPLRAKLAVPATFLLLTLYVLLMKPVGFVLTTGLYLFAQMLVLAPRKKLKTWFAAVLSVVLAVGIYLVFSRLLNVPLPAGILAF